MDMFQQYRVNGVYIEYDLSGYARMYGSTQVAYGNVFSGFFKSNRNYGLVAPDWTELAQCSTAVMEKISTAKAVFDRKFTNLQCTSNAVPDAILSLPGQWQQTLAAQYHTWGWFYLAAFAASNVAFSIPYRIVLDVEFRQRRDAA